MKIGVISDTHLRRGSPQLEELLRGPFREVETVIHAGDITEMAVLDGLGKREILAVCGNMDSPAIHRCLPRKRLIQKGKIQIGLIHGWGSPQGIEERIRGEFEGVDCIVYGHTHFPSQTRREGMLFFNPGSFSDLGGAGRMSVGILEVGDEVKGEIIYF